MLTMQRLIALVFFFVYLDHLIVFLLALGSTIASNLQHAWGWPLDTMACT
jgi:hypothetical protein